MCGIVGLAGPHELKWVHDMNGAIVHRGPDDQGIYSSRDGAVSLAMRRLSILDLEGGHQPMGDETGTVWIVFNGEIYNAPELRSRLEQQGHSFRTKNSDTEVLLHLYLEKGPAFLNDLNGMFAFVIHDQRKNLLFGARDRVGIKPLYYWHRGGRFAFASELKALLQLPFITREVDPQSLHHYMTLLYVPDQTSIISGVFRLPPGHSFLYDLRQQTIALNRYWQLDGTSFDDRSLEEWTRLLRKELHDAVGRWTLSDVPIACSLSGGLDSSAIVGLLAEQGYSKVRTYSLGFEGEEEQAWNELHLARQVAERWGTLHHEIILKPESLLNDLITMVWHLEEPYGGGLPSWYVFREMSKDVKVGLTGTGGDELFGNYGKFSRYEEDPIVHAAVSLRQRFTRGVSALAGCADPLVAASRALPSSWPVVGRNRLLSKIPALLRVPFGAHYYANFEFFSDAQKHQFVLAQHGGSRCQDTASYLQKLFDRSSTTDLRTGLAAVDFRTQLAEEFLFMTDRFSMAHSLEARTPLLDHQLVELAFRIPPSIRTKAGDPKHLLKRAVSDLLPPDLLSARKRGFTIPLGLWLRKDLRPLAERLLSPQRLEKQGIFQPQFYDRYVLPHVTGQADHTMRVWAAFMFQLWHVVFIEEGCTEKPAFSWKDLS
jgi:asparagine synthase (glutamine-hydrolysing)